MTKSDIIDRVARGTGLTKIETEAVVNGFLITVMEALKRGDRVELRGFGSFRVQQRAPRKARNPKTNEPVEVAMRYAPIFKVSHEFTQDVDRAIKRRYKPGELPDTVL